MKILQFLAVFFLVAGVSWADGTQAIFKEVQGTVRVLHGEKWIGAQKDLTVVEGQQIQTEENSSAVLGLFDGSELTISPKTQFTLTALKQPEADSKVIKFKLIWGQLEALVKKLTTASSSFEIESGGVVCGVRGTKFSMFNDGGKKPQVVVQVTNGSVYTIDAAGNHFTVQAGNQMKFVNGAKVSAGAFNGNNPNYKKGGNNASGSNNNGNSNGSNSNSGNSNGNSSNSSSSSGSSNSGNNANSSGNGGSNANGGNSPSGNGDANTGSNPTGGNNSSNNASTGNGVGAPGAPAPIGAGSGLADLNNQFQSSTLINTQNAINNPTVQQALQLNVQLQVGK